MLLDLGILCEIKVSKKQIQKYVCVHVCVCDINFMIFLSEMHNLNLIMTNHHTNPTGGTLYKITRQKYSSRVKVMKNKESVRKYSQQDD